MGQIRVSKLRLKTEMGRAATDFETWPSWAKEIPFENSDRVVEGRRTPRAADQGESHRGEEQVA
jgi:hypothetical protein